MSAASKACQQLVKHVSMKKALVLDPSNEYVFQASFLHILLLHVYRQYNIY
jgi:hypothetical protein